MERQQIYLLRFSDGYTMASTFLRFQEYYESLEFRGKFFSWEEFMDWYAKKEGNFTYFQDYEGFNIPSWVLAPFRKGKFDPLTEKEKKLLYWFENIPGDFYIIGVLSADEESLRHEIVHGLYYLFPKYRRKVIACVKRFNPKRAKKSLKYEHYYHPNVITDEINAFAVTGLKILRPRDMKRLRSALRKIFVEHFGFSIGRKDLPALLAMVHVIRINTSKRKITA